jgi:hypothetical protein
MGEGGFNTPWFFRLGEMVGLVLVLAITHILLLGLLISVFLYGVLCYVVLSVSWWCIYSSTRIVQFSSM